MTKVAILVENGFEDIELLYPYYRLLEEAYDVVIVGPEYDVQYTGKKGAAVKSQLCRFNGKEEKWDVVVIPGGWAPDRLRQYPEMLDLVKTANDNGAIIAAICHAGSVLVSANVLQGKTATCFKSIKDDMINAGATYVDQEVVVDGNLITSRTPKDLPVFCKTIIENINK